MPRQARQVSSSDIYHVMVRGVGHIIIFEDDADRSRYVSQLGRFSKNSDIQVLAWCLMQNHVHLLLRGSLRGIQDLMLRLGTGYAAYFNERHGRVGHLFQDRFRSEPVEDEGYLLTVVRYIHQNPMHGGLSENCSYRWSSYDDYIQPRPKMLTSTTFVMAIFGSSAEFIRFHEEEGASTCVDIDSERAHASDQEALLAAQGVLSKLESATCDPVEIASLARKERDAALCALKQAGLSIRQIARLTGIGRNIVARA